MPSNIIKNNIDISKLSQELNMLFNDYNIDISNILSKQNVITRKKILSFGDSLTYKFLCTYKNNTNHQIAADLSYKNNCAHVSNYYRKEQKFPFNTINIYLTKQNVCLIYM